MFVFVDSELLEEEKVKTFLSRSCTIGTWKGYNNKWKKWLEYRSTSKESSEWGLYLERLRHDNDKVWKILLFMTWMYNEKALRGVQLTSVVGCFTSTLEVKGYSTGFMKDGRILRGYKAAHTTVEEDKVKRKEKSSHASKLPLTGDMVKRARKIFWVKYPGWSSQELDNKARWLGIVFGYDSGLRPGQFTLREGYAEDHCVRFYDILFTTSSGKQFRGGKAFHAFMNGNISKVAEITAIDVRIGTHKCWKKKGMGAISVKTIARRSADESQFLNDMCQWWFHAKTKGTDELFTRYNHTNRKVLTRYGVSSAIKRVAVYSKLPKERFSAKSLRSGFATLCARYQVDKGERNARGGWSKKSKVPDTHYTSDIGSCGAMALGLSSGKGLTSRSLSRLAKLSE